nr:putative RNA-directed DNA polymerase, eukaryota, reverse transcriptase zinc-binding domain protein [Tanacetum cinerariifolium]
MGHLLMSLLWSRGRGRLDDLLSPFLFFLATDGLNTLLKKSDDLKVIKGIRVGADEVVVSNLQYADDTIIFGEWSRENTCNLINVLKCFEEVTGLKINFRKSKVCGVGVEVVEVDRMVRFMCCGVGEFLFMYLGLPIGVNMRSVSAWNNIIDIFKSRLSDWKAKTMSLGGRLTLVKSGKRKGKTACVKWERVISSFGDGGLSIGSLKSLKVSMVMMEGGGGDVGSQISGRGVRTDIIRGGKVLDGFVKEGATKIVGSMVYGYGIRSGLDPYGVDQRESLRNQKS